MFTPRLARLQIAKSPIPILRPATSRTLPPLPSHSPSLLTFNSTPPCIYPLHFFAVPLLLLYFPTTLTVLLCGGGWEARFCGSRSGTGKKRPWLFVYLFVLNEGSNEYPNALIARHAGSSRPTGHRNRPSGADGT